MCQVKLFQGLPSPHLHPPTPWGVMGQGGCQNLCLHRQNAPLGFSHGDGVLFLSSPTGKAGPAKFCLLLSCLEKLNKVTHHSTSTLCLFHICERAVVWLSYPYILQTQQWLLIGKENIGQRSPGWYSFITLLGRYFNSAQMLPVCWG